MPVFLYIIFAAAIYVAGYYEGRNSYKEKTGYVAEPVPDRGWRCPSCGKPHASYDSFCSCGASRPKAAAPEASESNAAPDTVDAAEEIRKYKQLLDEGILTQEEFDAKKKQILNL